jgi:phosphate transport system substrate-binding protein
MKITIAALFALGLSSGVAFARDNIQIAGSSTVLPYATIVAEAFGENFNFPTPVVESGGSSAGLKRFCEGVGEGTIDIANASRRIKDSEREACAANGVLDITEVMFGYDGIVFANSIEDERFAFTPAHIYLAVNERSELKTWDQVDSSFPNYEIKMFIPGTKHGTREVFEEKVLLEGCKEVGDFDKFVAELDDKKAAEGKCMTVRKDGRSVDIDGDYTETLANINANSYGFGVFGLSFYQNNTNEIEVATINGVRPSQETIASGAYPVSRPLYFYVKNANATVVPGIWDYVSFFVSDDMAGPNSELAEYGLVPDPELAETQAIISSLK